ncbi:MAG: hypothetical protein AAF607_11455 [Pseudomonadota bacterium]
MKVRDRETDIFSLSFLDIVSCAFGAVVLLLIISRPEMGEEGGASDSKDLFKQLFRAEAQNVQIAKLLEQEELALDGTKNKNEGLANQIQDVKRQTRDLEYKAAQLAQDKSRVEREIKARQELAQVVDSTPDPEPQEEVGGIPVDSEYVIFVIDTSGSMRNKWNRVKTVLDGVLDNHPKVKGFQIINDEGVYLKNRRSWIKDSVSERQQAIRQTNGWSPRSDSNPFDGIAEALKTYGQDGRKLAIYVFGDDFATNNFDPTAAAIRALNTSPKTGRKYARIHGIGFTDPYATYAPVRSDGLSFGLLMRAVAGENNGAYVSLPQ